MERTVIGLVLAKIEATYGTDPTPTPAANVIAVAKNSVKFDPKFMHIVRQILDGSIGPVQGLNAQPTVGFSFSVELRGNRTDGSANDISNGTSTQALEIDCLLQACDLTPTYTAAGTPGTSRDGYVTYTPYVPTDQGKGVTFYFYSGLKLHKVVACKGTFKIDMTAGKFGMIEFTFSGKYVAITDVAIATPLATAAFLNTVPPLFENSGSLVDAYSPVFTKLNFDAGLKVEKREDGNSTDGIAGFVITDRAPKVTIDPESVAEGTDSIWADLYANTKRTITGKIGTQGGNKFQITLVCVSEAVSYGDRSGIRTQQISYGVERQNIGDVPGSEMQLKFF